MPLFKKNHNKHDDAADNTRDDFNTTSPGSGANTLSREEQRYDPAVGSRLPTSNDPGMTGAGVAGRGAHHDYATADRQNVVPGHYPGGQQDRYAPGGTQAGTGMGTGMTGTQQHGGGHHMAGRAEQGIGSAVGSKALEARGAEKEQELTTIKQQSTALAEAERLEKQAMEMRERAVAHGAHPDNAKLGGGMI